MWKVWKVDKCHYSEHRSLNTDIISERLTGTPRVPAAPDGPAGPDSP